MIELQSSRYHRLILNIQRNNLLPLSFASASTNKHKILDFYSTGLIKEKISHKIVSSFEICDPCFFTAFRDAVMEGRKYVFDQLFKKYVDTPFCGKSKFVNIFVTECYLKSKEKGLEKGMSVLLIELFNFVLNCMFLSGCEIFFKVPCFSLNAPDKHFNEIATCSCQNLCLSTLFV
ncbi:hypothetical protein EIN_183880 [Entamoeba invadens IP1]|uniref:hypothetical protein n=1 Tax=Entamoeba invadens IP1 TaxID=370355 RepID=UPI0002C3F615|nr:hypothetical protein EIN_183880 [Entamoeba invadens IP1]ELP94071.1 hypothetical protein EIN_183880 [Entamoeba invadens IP1]|eukprot:XP_004260842.1 hypothetical protein EIN_183880 [Entamoeba invadens IP1]